VSFFEETLGAVLVVDGAFETVDFATDGVLEVPLPVTDPLASLVLFAGRVDERDAGVEGDDVPFCSGV